MNKIILGLFAVTLCFIFAESLTCNTCSVGILGKCFMSSTKTCLENEPFCYSGVATFSGISGFSGFNTLGCMDAIGCNNTSFNTTVFFSTITVTKTCCNTSSCNQLNGAPSAELSLTAAVSAALVASVWNSWLH